MKALKHGLSIVLPFLITFIVLKWIIGIIDSLFFPLINWILTKAELHIKSKSVITLFEMILFVLSILLISFIGKIYEKKLFRRFISYAEYLFYKIPFVKTLYNISAKFAKSVFSKDSMSFKKVVLVDFPRQGIKSLGFLVGENKNETIGKNKYLVIVPSIPNPTTGFLLFIDKSDIEFIDMSVEDGIKAIFSGGVYLLEE